VGRQFQAAATACVKRNTIGLLYPATANK